MFKALFGGGSDKPKSVRLGVNAYGKLPIYKDFISCGMTDAPAREFRVWIDKGFSHRWSTDEACAGAEIPPYSFLVRLPDSRGYAAGSLWGSSDEGGLRKFPFALFLSFPKDHGAADPVAAVEYLADIERRASELRFVFGPGASLSSFYQTYRGNEIDVLLRPRADVSRELRAELSGFSIAEFAESLFGDASVRAWPQLLASASSLVQSGEAGALRLPLSGRLPRAREVEFWLLWLERLDPKGKRPLTGVLYPHGHNPGRVVFFFRELKPEDFLLLHPTRADLASVAEAIARVPGGAEAIAGARRRGARSTTATPESEAAKEPGRSEPAAPEIAPPVEPEPPAAIVEPAPVPVPVPEPVPVPVPEAEPEPEPVPAPEPEAGSAPPAEASSLISEDSPFPEADAPSESAGPRLSAILALDPTASAGEPSSSGGPNGDPGTPPPEPGAGPGPEAVSAPPEGPPSGAAEPAAPAAPAVDEPPPPSAQAPPPEADPDPPEPPVAEPPAPPLVVPAPPAPPPVMPAPAAPAPPAPPPEWNRPLPALLDS